jgi:hypothetical protein
MSKYISKDFFWNKDLINYVGSPRPSLNVPQSFWNRKKILANGKKVKGKFYLHKIIPIPWQSKPVFDEITRVVFNVIEDHESLVYKNNLCSFCGIKINNNEECIRWTDINSNPFEVGPRVFSDNHPLHFDCMKQARVYCPYMRSLDNSEFEIGEYNKLRRNADLFINSLKENNNE